MFPPVAILRPFLRSDPDGPPPEQYLGANYFLAAKDHHWPSQANCVTAVRRILQNRHNTYLPHLWIGDFPAILTKYFSWDCLAVQKFKPGDLIFFYHTKREMLGHIAIAVDETRVFHCGYPNGPEILPFTELVAQQSHKFKEPISDPKALLAFRDTEPYGESHCLRDAIAHIRGTSTLEPSQEAILLCLDRNTPTDQK